MSSVFPRVPRTRQPQGATPLIVPASFVAAPWVQPTSLVTASIGPTVGQSIGVTLTSAGTDARAEYQLSAAPPVTGSLPWTILALQYWPTTPSSGYRGIVGLRSGGAGPTFCTENGLLSFYTDASFATSSLSVTAGLHCVALMHRGDGTGVYWVDGQSSTISGLGTTASARSVVTAMNWDAASAAYSPGSGAYQSFAAIINVALPDALLRQITGMQRPWQLFAPQERRIWVGAAAPSIPSIAAIYADSVTGSSVAPRITLSYP